MVSVAKLYLFFCFEDYERSFYITATGLHHNLTYLFYYFSLTNTERLTLKSLLKVVI
jgi:hypothetical protein